jgi:hypothetical protein
MPKGARIVDERNTVQETENFVIAVSGVAKTVGRALVAKDGIAREFWPPTVDECDPIVLTTDTETSWDIEAQNSPDGVPKAIANFDARTGRIEISVNDGTTAFIQVINPAPRAKGLFIFKVDVISGSVDGSPTAAWTDVLDLGTTGVFEYSVSNNTGTVGQALGQIDFSIAQDDGAGAPLAGTTVVKTIDFIAELTGSNLTMTTIPWILECIKVQEDAIIHVLTTPIESEGEAFVTGNECNQEVIREIYAQEWNSSFTVQVDQISGDAISGPDLGVELTTDVRRTWFIEATTDGEDFNAVIDLTISDGTASVTKRITLHVQRTDEDAVSDISTDFTQFDSIKDVFIQPDDETPLQDTITQISFNPDGTVTALTSAGPYVNFPQIWNNDSPAVTDPENFEVRCRVGPLFGDDIPDGEPLDVFLNLSSSRIWQYEVLVSDFGNFFAREIIETSEFFADVQEVGRPDTRQTKRFFMQCGISPFEFDQTGDQ